MIREILGLLANASVENNKPKFNVNLNKNRIRSISAFSSNSIFYFPLVVSDQLTPEEVALVARMTEKTCASFVVSCINLMPFHRIKADDTASIEKYLSQFHQNIGINAGPLPIGGAISKGMDMVSSGLHENSNVLSNEAYEDRLLEAYLMNLSENSEEVRIICSDESVNDMYNLDPIDDKTKVLQCQAKAREDELDTWGFTGYDIDDWIDSDDDDSIEDTYPEIDTMIEGSVKSAIDNIKYSLESISENKILSCKNLTKLATLESKLKGLKNRYAKYLIRYKRKYNENKKNGSKSKLGIRFNKMVIGDPKAFMQQYGSYIKIINKRLQLVDRRRKELRTRKGMSTEEVKVNENVITDLTDMDIKALDFCIESIDGQLNSPDSDVFIYDEINEALSADYVQKMEERLRYEKLHHNAKVAVKREQNAKDNAIKQAKEQAAKAKQYEDKYNKQRSVYYKQKENNNKKIADARNQADKFKYQSDKIKQDFDEYKRHKDVDPDEYMNTQHMKMRNNRDRLSNKGISYDKYRPSNNINAGIAAANGQRDFKVFDKEIFTKMDMQKANEALPTYVRASIGFIVDETEEVITRDVLVGIKSYVHKAPSLELIDDIYNCIINKRKFLKFVKFVTGEERSLSDLLFGMKELKSDALDATNSKSGEWRSAFRRRRRWAKMSVPYLTKEYTPNGTFVITMNEVNYIKDEYGIDIMRTDHVKMIMDSDFLLSFVVIDQANEMVYVTYDGHDYGFQQYTYAMLERESNTSDRMLRELYRSFAR